MEKLYALRQGALESPYVLPIAALVVFLAIVILTIAFSKKRKRRKQSHNFLCERNRKAVIDAIHSFYLANPKAEFQVTVRDLVARDLIKARKSQCPAKRAFVVKISRDEKGGLKGATVTCKSHGDNKLADI